jgi:hypothetical protein
MARKPGSKTQSNAPTKAEAKSSLASAKGSPWTFPRHSLEDAIRIAKAIEDKNAGNPMPAESLARALSQSNDWRFQDFLRSANQYGIVEGTGTGADVSLTQLGQDVVAPSDAKQRTQALLQAFRNVDLFNSVADFYGDKQISEDEFF